jgi:hypothetical protein
MEIMRCTKASSINALQALTTWQTLFAQHKVMICKAQLLAANNASSCLTIIMKSPADGHLDAGTAW